jgi:hypothetical protein
VDWLVRLLRPATAWVLAGLAVVLAGAMTPLSLMARQNPLVTGNAADALVALSIAAVGFAVAWHRPRNPIGWLLLAVGVSIMFYIDGGLYNVINYRLGRRLPLGPVVLTVYEASQPVLGLLPLAILLFPDGWLPSPRWRRLAGGYLTVGLVDVIALAQQAVYAITHHRTAVDSGGGLIFTTGAIRLIEGPVALIFFATWVFAVGYQVVSWRRAVGERQQQLSWLMAGGAGALISFLAVLAASALLRGAGAEVAGGVLLLGVAALPAGMGVAILRYRLYEIDRIISRTLAYAIVTGLLLGVYSGLVLLATRVLTVNSPVAVAAATLAAAALFSPVRRWVQLRVDRRFNRARYDADQTVAAFAARLKDTVNLDSVRDDLARAAQQALEPAHVSVWINERR